MTQYEKERLADKDMTEAGKKALKIMGNLLLSTEYDGVIKVKGHFVAHTLSEDGEVETYDLYDERGSFICSYRDFDLLSVLNKLK